MLYNKHIMIIWCSKKILLKNTIIETMILIEVIYKNNISIRKVLSCKRTHTLHFKKLWKKKNQNLHYKLAWIEKKVYSRYWASSLHQSIIFLSYKIFSSSVQRRLDYACPMTRVTFSFQLRLKIVHHTLF